MYLLKARNISYQYFFFAVVLPRYCCCGFDQHIYRFLYLYGSAPTPTTQLNLGSTPMTLAFSAYVCTNLLTL